MIKFLSTWIQGLAITVIIVSIFEMILPNGNIKKYVKMILGIYIIFSIISPFVNKNILRSVNVSQAIDNYVENSTNLSYSKEITSNEKNLDKIYKNTFEKEIVKTIENEGFKVYKCSVKGVFDAEKSNAGIDKIEIVLYKDKIDNLEGKKDIKKQEKDDLEKINIKIDNINEVKKVQINENNKLNKKEDNTVNAKDIDTLKKFLSKRYEIEKSIIDIHVR